VNSEHGAEGPGSQGASLFPAGRPVPAIRILGVRVHPFTLDGLHRCIAHIIRSRQKAVIANVNVHALNLASSQPWFRDFLNGSEYVFCDGHGVMLAARLLGKRLPAKITYAYWLPVLASFCARNGFSLFLLGGKPGVAEQAATVLRARDPNLTVAGTHHGYFQKRHASAENQRVIEAVNRACPDVLLVGLGMPLQEKWLAENRSDLDVRVALPAGAAFDWVAGIHRRPPPWMTEHGLEWFGRLLIEPRRLWKRYLLGNPLFFLRVLRHRITGRFRTDETTGAGAATDATGTSTPNRSGGSRTEAGTGRG